MKPVRRPLRLARETIRILAGDELDLAVGGAHPTIAVGCAAARDTPVTPECPSDYTYCINSCSD